MQYKYSVNGLDLTDAQGLANYAPKYFLDAGTTRPSRRVHSGGLVRGQRGGGTLVGEPATTPALISLCITVTSFGDLDTPEANFAANAAEIESIFHEDAGYPILRYFPGKDMEDVIITSDSYYSARVRVLSATWVPSLNDADWEHYKVLLEVPGGYLYTPWTNGDTSYFASTGVNKAVVTVDYTGSYHRDGDWFFGLRWNTGTGTFTVPDLVVNTDYDPDTTLAIPVGPINYSDTAFWYFSEQGIGKKGTLDDLPPMYGIMDPTDPVTEDQYSDLQKEVAAAIGTVVESTGSVKASAFTTKYTIDFGPDISHLPIVYFFYRSRL